MRLGVTGANGFVGEDIVRDALARGWDVVALVRTPTRSSQQNVTYRSYDLSLPVSSDLLEGVDALVHCAYVRADQRHRESYQINIRGTLALFELATSQGIGFTFLSSLFATPQALSNYGRHKFELERPLLERGASVVRSGLVVGDGGVVRVLYDTMRRAHVVALIDGGEQPVQCIGRRDLSAVVGALIESASPPGPITAAAETPITARQLALDIRSRFALSALAVSVPSRLISPVVALAEAVGLRPPITTENLLGLRAASVQPVTDVYQRLGVRLKPWDELLASLVFDER